MRYELTDHEWLRSNRCYCVDDRRILAAFLVLQSGAPWRDLPDNFVHHLLRPLRSLTTGWPWGQIMGAIVATHDAAVRTPRISTRVHHRVNCADT